MLAHSLKEMEMQTLATFEFGGKIKVASELQTHTPSQTLHPVIPAVKTY